MPLDSHAQWRFLSRWFRSCVLWWCRFVVLAEWTWRQSERIVSSSVACMGFPTAMSAIFRSLFLGKSVFIPFLHSSPINQTKSLSRVRMTMRQKRRGPSRLNFGYLCHCVTYPTNIFRQALERCQSIFILVFFLPVNNLYLHDVWIKKKIHKSTLTLKPQKDLPKKGWFK